MRGAKEILGLWGLRRLQSFRVDPDLAHLWSVAAAVLAGIGFICGLGWLVLAKFVGALILWNTGDEQRAKHYVAARPPEVILFYAGMALAAALLVLAYYYYRQAKSWEELGGPGRRRAAVTSRVLVVAAAASLLAGALL